MKVGKLKQFMHQPQGQTNQTGAEYQKEVAPWPPLGTINVIFTTPSRGADSLSGIISVTSNPKCKEQVQESKRVRHEALPTLGFSEEDKVGTFQPHDDALVVTLHIKGYDVKRVLVNQGSGAEFMYLDLYKGLNLKPEDISKYDSSLVGFDGRIVIQRGMIRLLVQVGNEVVQVNFTVAEAYCPTAILARPWLHAIGAVSSTLHLKVKYLTEGRVGELVGSQEMARQCLVVAIKQQSLKKVVSTSKEVP